LTMSEVTLIATFVPEESRLDDFLRLMGGMVDASRAESGCLRYDLYRDGEGRYFMVEDYRNMSAVEAHRETPHYRHYRAQVVDMLTAPISVVVLTRVGKAAD
jgi:quinol monooxygenase YgiN